MGPCFVVQTTAQAYLYIAFLNMRSIFASLASAEALASFDSVAQQLELERLHVDAQIKVGIAQAEALGQAIANMQIKLFGSPAMAETILRMTSFADGLGDVVGSLPAALRREGHEVRLVLPKYATVDAEKHGLNLLVDSIQVQRGVGTSRRLTPGSPPAAGGRGPRSERPRARGSGTSRGARSPPGCG